MSSLALDRVSVRYRGATGWTLRGVSLEVPHGSLTTLLGPSGCGKTTVLRLAAGLMQPGEGDVLVDGKPVTLLPPEQRSIGLVFQSHALFPHLSALENVKFAPQAAGRDDEAMLRQAVETLLGVGMGQRLHGARPAELSGGQQQRVALARSLVLAPGVLLLDEPLSSVEPALRRALREEIRSLQQRRGLTVLYVTHDQREALAVSDQVVLMNEGCVVQCGPPRALYERPATAFAASFMGEAGLFDGERHADGRVWIGPLALPRTHAGPAGRVRVAVRPEAWRIGPATGRGLPGSVVKRTYLGKAMEYVMSTPAGPALVHAMDPRAALEVGAAVSLSLGEHGACVIAR
jgi:iron(III) transport system ATP-binding protein